MSSPPVSCLLLVGPGCPHCASVLTHLSELVKDGDLAKLEIVNVASDPELAQELGVRTVPWFRIGEMIFQGVHDMQELRDAIQRVSGANAMRDHFAEQLSHGQLEDVQAFVLEHPKHFDDLIALLIDPETPTDARIGVAAIFEDIGDNPLTIQAIPALKIAGGDGNPRVRADACHLLGMIPSRESRDILRAHKFDPDETVRQIAREGL